MVLLQIILLALMGTVVHAPRSVLAAAAHAAVAAAAAGSATRHGDAVVVPVARLVHEAVAAAVPAAAQLRDAEDDQRAAVLSAAAHAAVPAAVAAAVPTAAQLGDAVDPVARLAADLEAGSKWADLVVYNRVPKSGSTSLQRQIERLSARLRYTAAHFVNPPIEGLCDGSQLDCVHTATQTPSNETLAAFADFVTGQVNASEHGRCLVDFHFPYVNFSHPAVRQRAAPIHINTLREPVARLLSSYHYARSGPRPLHLRTRFVHDYGNLTVDACVALYRECGCAGDCAGAEQQACTRRRCQDLFSGFNSQMMFFCPWGSDACGERDARALAEATRVLHAYDAVGVLELGAESRALLEAVLPSYFGGLGEMELEEASYEVSTSASSPDGGAEAASVPTSVPDGVSAAEVAALELEELDAAQEQLLSWMMKGEEEQEEDLDEMVDYDEFGDDEYADMYAEVEEMVEEADVQLKVGDTVMAKIYEVDEEGAYCEVGSKYSGFVPLSECSFVKLKTPLEVLRVGMTREFLVVEDEDDYGQIILSLAANEATVFWLRMRQLQEENLTVHVTVDSANRGGLLVKYGPYDGFVPVSQFGPQINPETMETMVGAELPVKFLEIDEDKERLVFSNKRVAGASTADLAGYKIGDVVEGTVQSMRPYGAFLDLGNGTVGLLHVSQISHERIISVDKILREGDRLKVMVLSMDQQRGRVTLSTKKLEPTPGDMLRDPQLVFEKAEEMAGAFRKRVDAAEMNARAQNEMGAAGTNYGDQAIQISSTKPIYSYVNLAKRLLGEHGEIQLSALGQAISTLVNVAEILKKDGLAVEKKLSTSLDSSTEDARLKAKMECVLVKSPKFDEIAEAQAKEHAAKQARAAEAKAAKEAAAAPVPAPEAAA
ncbi:hypothetical protein FOA52_006137 [Chlamydomonas sp. UWO 241]|nr:hypothetical protein FOA52_006137 [Chlamydomonas sp. UWO 241]